MKITDLEPYNYDPPRFEGELAVGWLDGGPPIESTGRIRPEKARRLLLDRLLFAARYLQTTGGLWMGVHRCSFCGGPKSPLRDDGRALWGNGEFRVIGDNSTIYVAPTLIAHYVEAHDYLPPQEFIEAVLCGRFIEERIDLDPTYEVVRTERADELSDALGEAVEIVFLLSSPWNGESPRPMLGIAKGSAIYRPWDGTTEHARQLLNAARATPADGP